MQIYLNGESFVPSSWDTLNRRFVIKAFGLGKKTVQVKLKYTAFPETVDAPEFEFEAKPRGNAIRLDVPDWSLDVEGLTWVHDCTGPTFWNYHAQFLGKQYTVFEGNNDKFVLSYRDFHFDIDPAPLHKVFSEARTLALRYMMDLGDQAKNELSSAPVKMVRSRFDLVV